MSEISIGIVIVLIICVIANAPYFWWRARSWLDDRRLAAAVRRYEKDRRR